MYLNVNKKKKNNIDQINDLGRSLDQRHVASLATIEALEFLSDFRDGI